MEDQALYMEQMRWDLYRRHKSDWDSAAPKDRKGPAPKEPEPIFSKKEAKEDKRDTPPDIGETVPVEEN